MTGNTLVSIPLYLLPVCDKEKWQLEICSESKPQSIMVLQGSWLIKHSASLFLSCLDGVTSHLLQFHHRLWWNRWGSSEQPLSCFWGSPWKCLHSQGRQAWQIPPSRTCLVEPASICVPGTTAWCAALCWGHWCCRDTSAALVPLALCYHTEGAQAPEGQCLLSTVKRPRNQPQITECLQRIHLPSPLFSVCVCVAWVGFSPWKGVISLVVVYSRGKATWIYKLFSQVAQPTLKYLCPFWNTWECLGRAWHPPYWWHQTGLWQRNLYRFFKRLIQYQNRCNVHLNRVSEKQG